MFSDARTVDIQERCLLCGGLQNTVKTSHWVSEKYSKYLPMCIYHYYMLVLCRSDVTDGIGQSVLTVMI